MGSGLKKVKRDYSALQFKSMILADAPEEVADAFEEIVDTPNIISKIKAFGFSKIQTRILLSLVEEGIEINLEREWLEEILIANKTIGSIAKTIDYINLREKVADISNDDAIEVAKLLRPHQITIYTDLVQADYSHEKAFEEAMKCYAHESLKYNYIREKAPTINHEKALELAKTPRNSKETVESYIKIYEQYPGTSSEAALMLVKELTLEQVKSYLGLCTLFPYFSQKDLLEVVKEVPHQAYQYYLTLCERFPELRHEEALTLVKELGIKVKYYIDLREKFPDEFPHQSASALILAEGNKYCSANYIMLREHSRFPHQKALTMANDLPPFLQLRKHNVEEILNYLDFNQKVLSSTLAGIVFIEQLPHFIKLYNKFFEPLPEESDYINKLKIFAHIGLSGISAKILYDLNYDDNLPLFAVANTAFAITNTALYTLENIGTLDYWLFDNSLFKAVTHTFPSIITATMAVNARVIAIPAAAIAIGGALATEFAFEALKELYHEVANSFLLINSVMKYQLAPTTVTAFLYLPAAANAIHEILSSSSVSGFVEYTKHAVFDFVSTDEDFYNSYINPEIEPTGIVVAEQDAAA